MSPNKCESVLILATSYPGDENEEAHRFVHVRNLYYLSRGLRLTVLSFAAKQAYTYEGVPVITLRGFEASDVNYQLLVSHQPNLRQHYLFLRKHGAKFSHFILFFHGHEVLRFKTAYPKPYSYTRKPFSAFLRNRYDTLKLTVWRHYIPQIIEKTMLIFVSNWMLEEFLAATQLSLRDLKDHYRITYNCVGDLFQNATFDHKRSKSYDFITIRSNLDGSKYCIDLINNLAFNNPHSSFLVIGKGVFFSHYEKAPNLIWEDRTLNHQEIIDNLQNARCALMPTRTDAQGLMMCEMATFCMPVITSDLPVCHEALDEFPNVAFIDNSRSDVNLNSVLLLLERNLPYAKIDRYFNQNTSERELSVFLSLNHTGKGH